MEGLRGAPHILQAGAAHPTTEELLRSLFHPGLKVPILVRRAHTLVKTQLESADITAGISETDMYNRLNTQARSPYVILGTKKIGLEAVQLVRTSYATFFLEKHN